jgi:hypothetical protein
MKVFICAAVTCLGLSSAKAALLYDPFNYSVGTDLTGQSPNGGATSWQAMGTSGASGSDPITIASGSLSVPGLAPSTGNSITYGGLGLTDRIPLGQTITSGTLYYSFAFKITDLGGLTATGGFMAGFNNSTGTVTNQPTAIATRVVTKLNGTGFQVGVDKTLGQGGIFRLRRYGFQRRRHGFRGGELHIRFRQHDGRRIQIVDQPRPINVWTRGSADGRPGVVGNQ